VSVINCCAYVLGMGYHETTEIIKKNSEAFLKKAL